MAGCYIPIPVMCDGCNAGVTLDVLFDGQADTANKEYNLSMPITDYRFLLVEYGACDIGKNYWTKLISWIVYPNVSDNPYEYNASLGVDNAVKETASILWHFPTADVMYIDYVWSYPWTVGTRISKIYGIK